MVTVLILSVAAPALADGPRAAATRKKTLIESVHFGSYYVPQVVAAGRNVIVFWRGPDQSGTQRTYAISKNGGKTFGEAKSIRIPVLFQLVAIAGDSAGNVYFAGTTGFANQIALVRSDSQIRNFTTGTIIDSDRNVVGIELATTPAGHLYLAYQTAFAVPLMGGGTTTAEQVNWSVSTDLGVSFAEFVKTNSRPTFESDSAPSMYAAVDGSVWLFRVQVATQERALTGDAYTGGLVLATRVDLPSDPVVIARSETPAGAPSAVRGYVSADGQLCISWAETSSASGVPVQSVFFTRHRLVVLEELHGLIRHYAEDVVSLYADLVWVIVGDDHHVFRVDLAEHAYIASEAAQIAPASDVQAVGAFVATVQVHEVLVDTDVAANPLSNVARMAVHKVFTALGMPTIFQHFVGDNRTVFCQRQIAPFEEAHQVID